MPRQRIQTRSTSITDGNRRRNDNMSGFSGMAEMPSFDLVSDMKERTNLTVDAQTSNRHIGSSDTNTHQNMERPRRRVSVNKQSYANNDRQNKSPSGIRSIVKEYGIGGGLDLALSWLSYHQWIMVAIAAIAIVIGMMTSKYVTVGISLLLLAIGYLMESRDENGDSMMTYIAAVIAFMVPFVY